LVRLPAVMAAALVAVLLPACTYAHQITVEAETYTASFNTGGEEIHVTICGAASGGYAVEGFDSPGEWIELSLTVPAPAAYADTLRSANELDYEGDARMTITGGAQGGGDLESYYHTLGLGIG